MTLVFVSLSILTCHFDHFQGPYDLIFEKFDSCLANKIFWSNITIREEKNTSVCHGNFTFTERTSVDEV